MADADTCWLQCYAAAPAKLCSHLAETVLQKLSRHPFHTNPASQRRAKIVVSQKPDSQELYFSHARDDVTDHDLSTRRGCPRHHGNVVPTALRGGFRA